jgi:hypothetical protein
VPVGANYTISIDGTSMKHHDSESVGIIGPGYEESVSDIPMRPGDKDTLRTEPYATKLSYTSSRAEHPTFKVGVNDADADYAFVVKGVSDKPGSTISLSLPAEKRLIVLDNNGTAGTSTVDLTMTRFTKDHHAARHNAIRLVRGAPVSLHFASIGPMLKQALLDAGN